MIIKRLGIFCFIILSLSLISIYYPSLTGKAIFKTQELLFENASVIRIIDGDTIETDNGTIRLLGINTPEKNKPYYQEAKDFLYLLENKTIQIIGDLEDLDKYQRKLRYVFYNNELINIKILEKGFGTLFMADDLKYEEKLKRAEDYARKNKKALWKESNDVCKKCIELQELDFEQEFFIIKNNCNFECVLNEWFVKDNANHFFKLERLNANQIQKYESKQNVWNNLGDRFFMRDGQGGLVIFYEY